MTVPARLLCRRLSAGAERLPPLYRLLLVARHRNSPFLRRIVSPGHDLVIEGFPRSATSFAVRAFMAANGWRDPRVATHVHSPAQVILAVRWGLPTLVCLREPEAAVVGWMAYARQAGQLPPGLTRRRELAWVRAQTLRYARFHAALLPWQAGVLLARFDEVTGDFGAVLDRLNARFGCEFDRFDHTAAATRAVFARAGAHLSPDPQREVLKAGYAALYRSPENARPRRCAIAAYRALLAHRPPVPEPAGSVRRPLVPAGPPGPLAPDSGSADAPVS